MSETLASYNNNPGNLRPPEGKTDFYKGQFAVDNKGFAVFETPEDGRNALIGDIKAKIAKGINTPESFVDRYAPPGKDKYGGENTEASRDNYKIWLATKLKMESTGDQFSEDQIEQIADAIAAFEGGTWQKKEEPEQKPEEVQQDSGQRLAPSEYSEDEAKAAADANKPFIGLAGAGLGLGVASKIETANRVGNILASATGQHPNFTQPTSRLSLQRYLNSQIAPNLNLPLKELEKVTGGNKIRTMAEVQNALKAIQAVEERRTAKDVFKMVPGRPGVFEKTGRVTTNIIPGRPGADLSQYETKAGPIKSAVQRQLAAAGEIGRSLLPSLARIGGAGLGGASGAIHGYEAFQLKKKLDEQRMRGEEPSYEDYGRLAAKSAAALGGGLAMIPSGGTQLGGLALSVPEMGFSLYDRIKEHERHLGKEPRGGLVDPMEGLLRSNTLGVAP